MDRKTYMSHARQKLVREYEAMLNKMSDPEILELMGSCPSCTNVVTSSADIDRAIFEGSSLTEVDKLVGADDHCNQPHACDNDPIPEEESLDEEIDGTFRDAIDMVADQNSPTVIVSYVYFDGPEDTDASHAKTYIFGDRLCLGMLIDNIIDKVESAPDDGGNVMYLDDSDS